MKSLRKCSAAKSFVASPPIGTGSSSSVCLIAKSHQPTNETMLGMRMIFYEGDAIAMQIFGAYNIRQVLFGNTGMQVGPQEVQHLPCTFGLIFLDEHKREWKQIYPEFEDFVLNMFDMPSQYHNNGKNGSYICISGQTDDYNNAENLMQAHFELQSFHGTKDTEQYRTKTFKIEILKSVCFNKGDMFGGQVEELLCYLTKNAISKDSTEIRKAGDVARGRYLKTRPSSYDTDLLEFDGSRGTTTSVMSSSISIFCSSGCSLDSGNISPMSGSNSTPSSTLESSSQSSQSSRSSLKTTPTKINNMSSGFSTHQNTESCMYGQDEWPNFESNIHVKKKKKNLKKQNALHEISEDNSNQTEQNEEVDVASQEEKSCIDPDVVLKKKKKKKHDECSDASDDEERMQLIAKRGRLKPFINNPLSGDDEF